MHLHKTHMSTHANTYADTQNTNKEHTLNFKRTRRGWENNELGLSRDSHQKITQDDHSQAVRMGKQRMIPKAAPTRLPLCLCSLIVLNIAKYEQSCTFLYRVLLNKGKGKAHYKMLSHSIKGKAVQPPNYQLSLFKSGYDV